MNIIIDTEDIRIELSKLEKLLSLHDSFKIQISQIIGIYNTLLPYTWKEIRAPGTEIPGLIKAGTFYTFRGTEFWMLRKKDNPVRIELKNNKFKRLIVGIDNYERWVFVIENLKERII